MSASEKQQQQQKNSFKLYCIQFLYRNQVIIHTKKICDAKSREKKKQIISREDFDESECDELMDRHTI